MGMKMIVRIQAVAATGCRFRERITQRINTSVTA
jgi:hypothetical protein